MKSFRLIFYTDKCGIDEIKLTSQSQIVAAFWGSSIKAVEIFIIILMATLFQSNLFSSSTFQLNRRYFEIQYLFELQ